MKSHLSSLTLAAALFCGAVDLFGHSAVEPAPRPDKWWQDRHESFNKRVAELGQKAQVIFIGDSITQGWENEGKQVWEKYYTHRNAINLGIGGDRTQHVLWRLENGNLSGLKPKAAVVMIGTNNSNGEDNTPGQISDGVAAIVKKLQSTLPDTKILLLAIFPRSENFSAQRGKILQVNQVLQKLDTEKNVEWIDFGHQFITSEGLIPRDLMPDYLHLSPKAYGIWAAAIEEKLSSILGDKPVAGSAQASADISGEWIWTIQGPDGNPIDAPLIIKADGNKVSGKFARGDDRWLEIENGSIQGNEFSWTVKRDRPDGSMITYKMKGKLENGKITGTTSTTVNGEPLTTDWSARRK